MPIHHTPPWSPNAPKRPNDPITQAHTPHPTLLNRFVSRSLFVCVPPKKQEELDPTQYFANRTKLLAKMEAEGTNTYPHKFNVAMQVGPSHSHRPWSLVPGPSSSSTHPVVYVLIS